MKILVISNMYPSRENPGYGVFVKNFIDSISAQGWEVNLSVVQGRGKNRLDKALKYLKFGFSVLLHGLTQRYDCIYVHYVAHSMVPVMLLMHLKHAPVICNAHGEDLLPTKRGERLLFSLVRHAISKAKLIVVPSPYFESIAEKLFPQNEVFVSPSAGVDLGIFKPLTSENESLRTGTLRLGFVSRVAPGKGWDILLIAVKTLRSRHPELSVSLAIVGEGSENFSLATMIDELGLRGVVSHLGSMTQRDLPNFYSSLDVFVFPTLLPESLGLVGLEALACGIPAICSDIGGIRSYMRHGINGYLFQPGDSDALAESILRFSQLNIDEIRLMRESALATAQEYGHVKVGADLHAKLVEVISNCRNTN